MLYYKKGDIINTIPWERPSKKAFNKWLKEWSNIPGIGNYELYLTGAFCQNYFLNENIDTWDIDLFLTGSSEADHSILKNILQESIKIGFKNKLLIDIYWRKDLPTFKNFSTRKIITFTEVIYKSDTADWSQAVPGSIQELIPGLYMVDDDPIPNYNKFISKNYKIACKKVNIEQLD